METLLSLSVVCAGIMLVGWLYVEFSIVLKRRMAKPVEDLEADEFPWPSHRP